MIHGVADEQVCERTELDIQSLRRLQDRLSSDGIPLALLDRPRAGRPLKQNLSDLAPALKKLREADPERFDAGEAVWWADALGVSPDTVWRAFRNNDVSMSRERRKSLLVGLPRSQELAALAGLFISPEVRLAAIDAKKVGVVPSLGILELKTKDMKSVRSEIRRRIASENGIDLAWSGPLVISSGYGPRISPSSMDAAIARWWIRLQGGLDENLSRFHFVLGGEVNSELFLGVISRLGFRRIADDAPSFVDITTSLRSWDQSVCKALLQTQQGARSPEGWLQLAAAFQECASGSGTLSWCRAST